MWPSVFVLPASWAAFPDINTLWSESHSPSCHRCLFFFFPSRSVSTLNCFVVTGHRRDTLQRTLQIIPPSLPRLWMMSWLWDARINGGIDRWHHIYFSIIWNYQCIWPSIDTLALHPHLCQLKSQRLAPEMSHHTPDNQQNIFTNLRRIEYVLYLLCVFAQCMSTILTYIELLLLLLIKHILW